MKVVGRNLSSTEHSYALPKANLKKRLKNILNGMRENMRELNCLRLPIAREV